MPQPFNSYGVLMGYVTYTTHTQHGQTSEDVLIIFMFGSCNRWNTIILESPSIRRQQDSIYVGRIAPEPQNADAMLLSGTSQNFPHSPVTHNIDATPATARKRSAIEIGNLKLQAEKRRLLFESLRPLQREALHFIQKTTSSIIAIMPTGSGKTSLIWTFKKPGMCSIIFAPFILLGQQLTKRLKEKGLAVAYPFQDVDGSVYGILATADFIVMPYEAAPTAADLLRTLHELGRLGPVWIDEVRD